MKSIILITIIFLIQYYIKTLYINISNVMKFSFNIDTELVNNVLYKNLLLIESDLIKHNNYIYR